MALPDAGLGHNVRGQKQRQVILGQGINHTEVHLELARLQQHRGGAKKLECVVLGGTPQLLVARQAVGLLLAFCRRLPFGRRRQLLRRIVNAQWQLRAVALLVGDKRSLV